MVQVVKTDHTDGAVARTSSAEFELLCLVARPRPDLDAAHAVLKSGFDFTELLRLAAQHKVRPQLLAALSRLSWGGVPASVRAECDAFQRFHLSRALSLSDELRRVDELFSRNDVPVIAFKGVALAAFLYGDLSQREYGDLDIIVPSQHVAQAERLLGALGYSGPHRDSEFRHAFLAFQRQYAFEREDIDAWIDLHWHFNGAHSPFPLQPQDIWNDRAEVAIGDRRIATLSGANLALLLAGHGTKEAWKALGWVRDFATLIHREPDLDWAGVFRRAQAQGCGNAVLLGCVLGDELLGVPMPTVLAKIAQDRPTVGRDAAAIAAIMRRGVPLAPVRPYLEDLGLCDRWQDKAKSIIWQGFTRTASDYSAWPLPPPLWRFYRLIRPFRLAFKATAVLLAMVRGH
jgi:hypothetical protein